MPPGSRMASLNENHMASHKRIDSVAHSTAHHAVSGLCHVNPHLRIACTSVGRGSCSIDLLAAEPCPLEFRQIKPIRLSIGALKDKFLEILCAEGFGSGDLSEATLIYEFPQSMDDYCSNCAVRLKTVSGYSATRAVDYFGRTGTVTLSDPQH